jgi:hypothetical protein
MLTDAREAILIVSQDKFKTAVLINVRINVSGKLFEIWSVCPFPSDQDPGSGAFDPLVPGSGMEKNPDPGKTSWITFLRA